MIVVLIVLLTPVRDLFRRRKELEVELLSLRPARARDQHV